MLSSLYSEKAVSSRFLPNEALPIMDTNIAVILTDRDRRILWVNDDFTSITGYSLSEVQGKKPSLLQGPKTEKDAVNHIRKNLEDLVSFKGEITNYRKNGEEYLCRLVIHPIFDSNQQLTNFIAFEVDGNQVDEEAMDIPLFDLDSKYQSSSLKGAEELRLFARLRDAMERNELYLDPNLTLRDVADHLATNTKYLSQVVNHQYGHNFQYFVNTYRVEAVKRALRVQDNANLTLFGLAMQCGFKNKSTFYKVFKEITGKTPREYMIKKERNGQPLSAG